MPRQKRKAVHSTSTCPVKLKPFHYITYYNYYLSLNNKTFTQDANTCKQTLVQMRTITTYNSYKRLRNLRLYLMAAICRMTFKLLNLTTCVVVHKQISFLINWFCINWTTISFLPETDLIFFEKILYTSRRGSCPNLQVILNGNKFFKFVSI